MEVNDTFKIKVDGKKCSFKITEKNNSIKMKTIGKDCKKVLGKDFFKNIEMILPDSD